MGRWVYFEQSGSVWLENRTAEVPLWRIVQSWRRSGSVGFHSWPMSGCLWALEGFDRDEPRGFR